MSNKRFNANAVISPDGKIYRSCCMGHLTTMMQFSNYNNIKHQLFDNNIGLDVWYSSMTLENKWMIISGADHYINTIYHVTHSINPTKQSLDALFQIIKESEDCGDLTTARQLYEKYKELINK